MLRTLSPFALLGSTLAAQFLPPLELAELLVQPAPGGHQAIEVVAVNVPLDTTGYHLVVGATAVPLPAVQIAPYGVFVLHLGVAGVSTPQDLWLPTAPALGVSDSIALFRSAAITAPGELLDYLAWGGAVGPQAAMAVQVGRWTTVGASAVLPPGVGATLANRRSTRTNGNLFGPAAWYQDTTPTLGAENDAATTASHGPGCVSPSAPWIGFATNFDHGPWLGEPSTLIVTQVQTFAVMVLSTVATPPVPLDGIGMPGCFANVALDLPVLLPVGVPTQFVYTLPLDPLLTGRRFYAQAFVLDSWAGNAIGAFVTPSVQMLIGSR
jgi:hypothetical protein